jgi:hypothetical protein
MNRNLVLFMGNVGSPSTLLLLRVMTVASSDDNFPLSADNVGAYCVTSVNTPANTFSECLGIPIQSARPLF